MRINHTWQQRFFVLIDNMLYFFKNENAVRPRGMIPIDKVEIIDYVETDIKQVVPEDCQDNVFCIRTPHREYVVYTETVEEKINWMKKIDDKQTDVVGDRGDVMSIEQESNKELLARHPLILEVLSKLGSLWEALGHTEEALILYIQGKLIG